MTKEAWYRHMFEEEPNAQLGNDNYKTKQMLERIQFMNETFKLEVNNEVTDLGKERLKQFVQVLADELIEHEHVYVQEEDSGGNRFEEFDSVALADLFTDLLVYLLSESCRWGIPIFQTFHAVMDSQESKLVDGEPVMAPDGSKFIKGPHYKPPEETIMRILNAYGGDNT